MAGIWPTLIGAWLLVLAPLAAAQDATPAEAAASDAGDVVVDEAPVFADDELDAIVAPIALYPDALLAQVFVAATYPLDVIKASRILADHGDDAAAGAAALEAEGFDPSITVLAQGFPTVVDRMAEEIDWTETLGEAVLVQTDDVLDAVQRQRARAQAVGNLETNEAQVVTVEDDAITIAPADPQVVYVPAYDPALAYTQPAPQPPVVYTEPTDPGYSGGELIATGVVAFGAGMLVNEVFSDDDDWDDYWRGPPPVRWSDDRFYPRPGRGGINAGGDVNINVDRSNDRLKVDRDRVTSIDRDGAWQPDARRQNEARQKVAARGGGADPARAARPQAASAGGDRAALQSKLQARGGGGDLGAKAAARQGAGGGGSAKLREAAAQQQGKPKAGAFAADKGGLAKTKDASKRGQLSAAKAKGDGGKVAAAQRAGGGKIAKPAGVKKAAAKGGGPKGGAFKKAGGTKAAARGKKSGGGKLKGRRG